MSVCPTCLASHDATIRICPGDGTPLPAEPTADANIGQLLEGKYRVDAFISAGGMGSVYRATHVMLDKTVAVKLIRKQFVQTAEAAVRFQREARAASNLAHPNIAAVFDFGQTANGTLYIAMEYVEGPSLKAVIEHDGPMDPAKIVAILGPVAGALARAHRQHIIHRDLKPQNILLATDRDGHQTPKLLDFGIAKTADEPADALTMTGYALGTPQYMSPEQAMGKPVDGRSDLYSLGVVLYEMLIGEVPFADTSVAGVLLKQMTAAPDAPSRRRPDVRISPVLEAVAMRCLDKEPGQRFQSADEFIAALSQFDTLENGATVVDGRPAAAAVPGTPGRTAADSEDPAPIVPAQAVIREKAAAVATVAAHSAAPEVSAPAAASAPQGPRTLTPSALDSSGPTADRLTHDPTAPQPVTATLAPANETPARIVLKPGTQPTVVVPALSPAMTSAPSGQRAAPGPAFWIAAAVIVLAVVGSGAWVIRTWAPVTPASDAAPAPTATPAMAQPAPAVEALEKPSTEAATASLGQERSTSSQPDVTARPADTAASPVTRSVETPPVSASVTPDRQPTRPAALSRPGSAPPAGSAATASAAGAAATPPAARSDDALAQAVPDSATAPPAARERTAPPPVSARAGNPAVFVDCNGPPEICSPVRSAIADALRKDHMEMAAAWSRADVTLAVDVEVVEQRVQQSFGTTFAPRTYSVDVSAESHGLVVAMPPARTFSFDVQVGRERANENARLIASEAVEKIRDFWNQRP